MLLSVKSYALELTLAGLKSAYLSINPMTENPQQIAQIESLIEKSDNFITKNPKLSKSPQGIEFLARHEKMKAYFQVRENLKNCSLANNPVQIASSLKQFFGEELTELECHIQSSPTKTLDRLDKNLQTIAMSIKSSDLVEKLYYQALENTLKSYLRIQYIFGESKEKTTATTVKKLCSNDLGKTLCSAQTIKRLQQVAKPYIKSLKAESIWLTSPSEITFQVQEKIQQINKNLKKIKPKLKKGKTCITDEAEYDPQAYENYLISFASEMSEGVGILLGSDIISNKMGSLRHEKDDLENDSCLTPHRPLYYPKHNTDIDISDVIAAKNESLNKLNNYAKKLNKQYLSRESLKQTKNRRRARRNAGRNKERNIKELITTYPAAVAKVLLKNPQYSSFICDRLKTIEKQDADRDTALEVVGWSSMLLGLGVGGLGVKALTHMIRGNSLQAAAAGRQAAQAGLALGVKETAHQGSKATVHYAELASFEKAFLSEAGATKSTAQSLKKYRTSLANFYGATTGLALSLGFSVLNIHALKATGSGLKHLNQSTSSFKAILQQTKNPKFKKNLMLASKDVGQDVTKTFMTFLSQAPKELLRKILKKLPNLSVKRLKTIMKGVHKRGRVKKCK